MSLTNWKKAFYPIEAYLCDEKDALEHSIQKWTGLLKCNRKKHKIVLTGAKLTYSNYTLIVASNSCALCHHHYHAVNCPQSCSCTNCPFYKVLGKTCTSEYDKFFSSGDARPMLNALKKVRKAQ